MARQSLTRKLEKQRLLFKKYQTKRQDLLKILKNSKNEKELIEALSQFQRLKKNSFKTRMNRRCFITGNARGVSKFCNLSRHSLREFAHDGLLPGITKSSW